MRRGAGARCNFRRSVQPLEPDARRQIALGVGVEAPGGEVRVLARGPIRHVVAVGVPAGG